MKMDTGRKATSLRNNHSPRLGECVWLRGGGESVLKEKKGVEKSGRWRGKMGAKGVGELVVVTLCPVAINSLRPLVETRNESG